MAGSDPVLLLHAAVTSFLCGLIWTVQLVHYPLFARVGVHGFVAYETEHQRRISWIVMPAMVTEMILAGWIATNPPAGVPTVVAVGGAALVMLVWFVTALQAVPNHRVLSKGFDPRAHRRLVRSNWWRTIPWTARTLLAFVMLAA